MDSSPNELSGTFNGGYAQGGVERRSARRRQVRGVRRADRGRGLQTRSSPTRTYSEELWFNTTTTRGGKLIGFGTNQFGSSGGYDRHVYMFNDGRLRFGTYTGQLNVIDSPASFNDGKWHHLVATQGPDGMKLYVDNTLVGTNAQTGAQDYSGYWRVGGDNTWGGTTATTSPAPSTRSRSTPGCSVPPTSRTTSRGRGPAAERGADSQPSTPRWPAG